MTASRKLLLGAVAFAAVSAAALAPGLYLKHAAARRRGRVAERAKALCAVAPTEFATKPADERSAMLAEAVRLAGAVEADDRANKAVAAELRAWSARQLNVQVELGRGRRRLVVLAEQLAEATTVDADEQLAPAAVARLKAGAQQAEEALAKLEVAIDGKTVDSSVALAPAVSALRDRAAAVVSSIIARQKAYDAFAASIEKILKDPNAQAGEEALDALDKWIAFCRRDQQKKRRLEAMYAPLVARIERPGARVVLARRLDAALAAVAKAKAGPAIELRAALDQCDRLADEARRGGVHAELLDRAGRETAGGRQELSAKVKAAAKAAATQALIDEIAARAAAFAKAKPADAKRIAAEARSALKRLEAADADSGRAMRMALTGGIVPDPAANPPAPVVTRYGPDWKGLDASRQIIEEIPAACRKLSKRTRGAIATGYIDAARKIEDYLRELARVRRLSDEKLRAATRPAG